MSFQADLVPIVITPDLRDVARNLSMQKGFFMVSPFSKGGQGDLNLCKPLKIP